MSLLTQQQIGEFSRDGVLVLRGVFNDWIELLRTGVETNMREPGPFGREYLDEGQAGQLRRSRTW